MKRNPSTTTQALKLLMQDHRRIRKLMRRAYRSRRDPRALGEAIAVACREIVAHAEIEERLFYPALARSSPRARVGDAQVAHDVVGQLVARLAAMTHDDPRYLPTFRVLSGYLEQHIDEEEDDLFTRAADSRADFGPLVDALLERQKQGGLADVDLEVPPDADEGGGGAAARARDPQRVREPGRRGAH